MCVLFKSVGYTKKWCRFFLAGDTSINHQLKNDCDTIYNDLINIIIDHHNVLE